MTLTNDYTLVIEPAAGGWPGAFNLQATHISAVNALMEYRAAANDALHFGYHR